MAPGEGYYNRANPDLLRRIPLAAQRVLEVGCGAGALAAAYRKRNPLVHYTGIESHPRAAESARRACNIVIVGDIEHPRTLEVLDDSITGDRFDVLVLGDVLEHLRDPWSTLKKLAERLTPESVCVVCIPNVGHWSVVAGLLRGEWRYQDEGLLDRTHLRFFTLDSATALFRGAGLTVLDASSRIMDSDQAARIVPPLLDLAPQLGTSRERMHTQLTAFQWVIRGQRKASNMTSLVVVGMGLRKQAGVNEARVDYPLEALSAQPATDVSYSEARLEVPSNKPPGILLLHRRPPNVPAGQPGDPDSQYAAQLERLAASGWVMVLDFDDDPRHFERNRLHDFFGFKAVHAVSASTEPLADLIRQWNPNVKVLPNAILELPEFAAPVPKSRGRLRVFFGAINRQGDWQSVADGIFPALSAAADEIECVVVHDRAFFDAIPDGVPKRFHGTATLPVYTRLLAECDVALLPLADTEFNRHKSDLKFIECCAAGVVPVCSPIVYAKHPEHAEIGVFASTSMEWRDRLGALLNTREEIHKRKVRGLAYVKQQRMHGSLVAEREAWYRALLTQRDELECARQARITQSRPGGEEG